MEIDPVCGMEVDRATAEWKTEHAGTIYFFCSKGCLDDFLEDPVSYGG
jgi:Cu+-exporting ATPase